MERPTVAVVIPARDEEATLERCLRSLLSQSLGPAEIVVVDDGSSDRTPQILRGFAGVTVLQSGGGGPSRARNLGLLATRAEVVAFTDADCICHERWLEELLAVLASGDWAGVGGDQQSPRDESDFGRRVQAFLKAVGFVADYVRTTDRVIEVPHNPTCNVAYRRQVLLQSGGFDEALWPGEDVDLDHRIRSLGHRLAYTPRAVVEHYRPRDLSGFRRMMRNYGRAQAYLVRKHGPFRPLHAEPLLALGALGAAPLLASPPLAPLTAAAALGLPFALFRLRGACGRRAAGQVALLYETLLWWNLGFAEQWAGRGMARRAASADIGLTGGAGLRDNQDLSEKT
jgi:GT2 family glycosyltransferase